MVPPVAVSSVHRVCWRFFRDGGDSGNGGGRSRVRFVADFVPTLADDGRGAECCLRSRSGGGGKKGDGGSAGGLTRGRFAGVVAAAAFDSLDVRFSSALRGRLFEGTNGGGGGGGATRRISSSDESSSGGLAWLDRRLPMAVCCPVRAYTACQSIQRTGSRLQASPR